MARDVKFERIDDISSLLTNWITNCDSILSNIDVQGKVANSIKSDNLAKKIELDNYINQMKKTIKVNNQEMEDVWEINSMQQHHEFEKYDKLNKRSIYNKSKNLLKNRNQRY